MRKWVSKNPDKDFEKNEQYKDHNATPGEPIKPTDVSINTQTQKIKGTGAAIRGTKFSKNSQ